MPPKAKLHKATGKSNTKNQKSTPQPPENVEETNNAAEIEQQFELELCWCIQQLQTALKDGKLNPKQVQDHTRALNTLMSNSAPIVKKRLVMRLSFGDYRDKMAKEENKLRKTNEKLKVYQAMPNNKSIFIKKSPFATSNGSSFKFNFSQPEAKDISEDIAKVNIEENKRTNFQFAVTDNSFRFNFENAGVSANTSKS